jgi:putative transposase
MTSHVHLLPTPEQATSVPQLMVSVGRRYIQCANHTYGRSGALRGGRYKSSLVQAETHLFLCQRYVELNSVRAGMVSDTCKCSRSSHRANALALADPIIATMKARFHSLLISRIAV